MTKTVFAALGVTAVIAGTVALRSRRVGPPRPQLTPAQRAELVTQPPAPVNDAADLPKPPPEEPEIDDGEGS